MTTNDATSPGRAAARRRALVERLARPLTAALLAGALALAWYVLGPPGGDAAAHVYQTGNWREHGWRFWDNFWYAGRYSQVNYSLLYYPLAGLLSLPVAAIGSVAGASAAFAGVVRRQWPSVATWPTVAFALLAPLAIPAGTYPFMLGTGLGLATLMAVQARRIGWAVAGGLATTLAHPLALVFLLSALAGMAAVTRPWRADRRTIAIGLGLLAVAGGQVVLLRAFSAGGARYPFDPKDAAAVGCFCLLGIAAARGLGEMRALRGVFVAYAALTAIALTVASPIGGNVARLLLIMGTPLLLLPLAARRFQPRWLVVALVGPAMLWQSLPAVAGWRTIAGAKAQSEEFWAPAVEFATANHDSRHRFEVVATADNWEALYLARQGLPLARGWFRQDDWPENAILYERLSPDQYRAWLRRMGVRYVLLPDDPLDRTARREADILRSGRSGLHLVARTADWRFYELPDAQPIATPADAITITSLTQSGITLRAERAGRFRLSLRYTPYWSVVAGNACVSPAKPWGTWLEVAQPGPIEVAFDVRAGAFVGAVLGRSGGCPEDSAPVVPIAA